MKVFSSLLLLFFMLSGFALDGTGQRKGPAARRAAPAKKPAAVTPEVQRRLDSFKKVWETIDRYYFDEKFNGVNWSAVKAEFEPRIRRAVSDEEAHRLLGEMVGRLKVSHLQIVPPSVYQAIETAKVKARERRDAAESESALTANGDVNEQEDEDENSFSNYGIGVDVRLIDNKFVVTRVDFLSPAYVSGIKPGYILESINDVSLTLLISQVKLAYPNDVRVLNFLPLEIVNEFLNGEDEIVKLGYVDEKNESRVSEMQRRTISSVTVSLGSNMPERQLKFEKRSLSEKVGYIRFDSFALPVVEQFCEALELFHDKPALVIDLRGNLGGVLAVSSTVAGMLSEKPVELGTLMYRHGFEKIASTPKARNYKGKVVVLVDNLSMSAAEMLAAALQESRRATVIGERTAGETLPAVSVALPTGATFLYPIANFKTAAGKFIEGRGVIPDKVVTLSRTALLAGTDPHQNAAIAAIEQMVTTPSEVEQKTGTGNAQTEDSGAAPPPPPPPMKASPTKNEVGVAVKESLIDDRAREFMNRFAELAGGAEAFSKIESYEMSGDVAVSRVGSTNLFSYQILRSGKDLYAEVLSSPSTGEIKDVRNGKTIHIKGDLGFDHVDPFPLTADKYDLLSKIKLGFRPEDFRELKYVGEYEIENRKVHLLDGVTTEGGSVALFYHSDTHLLAGYEGPMGGVKFDDYRNVGDVMMPHRIRSGLSLDIQLSEIKLNTKIDPARFEHRERCFDRRK